MCLSNDDYFDNLDKKTLQQRLINYKEFKNDISLEDMKTN